MPVSLLQKQQKWTQDCSDVVLAIAREVEMILLIAVQRFGDGTPSVLEFHLISYTTSFAVVSQDSLKRYWLRAYLTFCHS